MSAGHLARLGATPDFHHGLLALDLTARAFFDSVETENRGKALFEKAWPLREALDRNEKRSSSASADQGVRGWPRKNDTIRSEVSRGYTWPPGWIQVMTGVGESEPYSVQPSPHGVDVSATPFTSTAFAIAAS